MAKHLEVVEPAVAPPVWAALRNEAERASRDEPALASLLNSVILAHDRLSDALSFQFARKIADQELRAMSAREIAEQFNQRTVYDATYAALAEFHGCEFWTADKMFYDSVKATLLFVKYLPDYP